MRCGERDGRGAPLPRYKYHCGVVGSSLARRAVSSGVEVMVSSHFIVPLRRYYLGVIDLFKYWSAESIAQYTGGILTTFGTGPVGLLCVCRSSKPFLPRRVCFGDRHGLVQRPSHLSIARLVFQRCLWRRRGATGIA